MADVKWPLLRVEYTEADDLVEAERPDAAFAVLTKHDDVDTAHCQWRIARCHSMIGDNHPKGSAEQKAEFNLGLAAAKRAVAADDANPYSHKWCAIMMGQQSSLLGTKEKIQQSYNIKEEALKTLEQLPTDASTNHLLGQWCIGVAGLSWFERKAASAFFATPPESSYEEALQYLLQAAENRHDWIRNAKFIGDVYVLMKDKSKAKEWYAKTVAMPCLDDGSAAEKAAQEEAAAALKKL